MKSKSILSACLLLIAIPMPAFGESFADNWHQWRGPNATGVSPTADPPVAWSEDENVKWKVAIEGQGTSTPIIWNDKVFVLTAINTGVKDPSIPDPEDQPKTNFFDIKQPQRPARVCCPLSRSKYRQGDLASGCHHKNTSPRRSQRQRFCTRITNHRWKTSLLLVRISRALLL